jgi:hypothetical protein
MEHDPNSTPPAPQEAAARRRPSMDTFVIPPGVDLELAGQRNRLIIGWRDGRLGAEDTLYELMTLYYEHQPYGNETGPYLMQSSYQFPAEAGIDSKDAAAICHQAAADMNRGF